MSQGELAPRGPRTMVFHKDVDQARVGPERYDLALALRELAQRPGVTLNRYAVRVSWDRSTLSRFLSGALVPPAEFVEQLIDDGDRETGAELTRATRELVRKLHRTALRATSPEAADLQDLRDKLTVADQESRHLQRETRLLREMVRNAHEQLDEQQGRLRQLEHAGAADRLIHRAELDQYSADFESLKADRDSLQETLTRLTAELGEAERRAQEAEARCTVLEQQLEAAETWAEERETEEQASMSVDLGNAPAAMTTNGGVSFHLGITTEQGAYLSRTLDKQVPVPLTELELRKLTPRPGILQLVRRRAGEPDERMHVGKADRSLPQRLDATRRKILGRKNISPEEIYFTYAYIEDDMSFVAPERLVIKHLVDELGVELPWNFNGFSNKDTGRSRDRTVLKPEHFDMIHPIDLDWSLGREGHRQISTQSDFINYIKLRLPYDFRGQLNPEYSEMEFFDDAAGSLTADSAFRLLALNLGGGWQISALKGRVILYEENVRYPNAIRYYRGKDVQDA